jgi:hypothetical protein
MGTGSTRAVVSRANHEQPSDQDTRRYSASRSTPATCRHSRASTLNPLNALGGAPHGPAFEGHRHHPSFAGDHLFLGKMHRSFAAPGGGLSGDARGPASFELLNDGIRQVVAQDILLRRPDGRKQVARRRPSDVQGAFRPDVNFASPAFIAPRLSALKLRPSLPSESPTRYTGERSRSRHRWRHGFAPKLRRLARCIWQRRDERLHRRSGEAAYRWRRRLGSPPEAGPGMRLILPTCFSPSGNCTATTHETLSSAWRS